MEISKEISIFLLCLLMGVAVSRYINDDDTASEVLQPIISQTRQRRICAELCMSGLGGDPCGEGCVDLIPDDMPVQYAQTEHNGDLPKINYSTRNDMCDVLCENNLGNPLCMCNTTKIINPKANFFEVCRAFCTRHHYRIYGCPNCTQLNEKSQDVAVYKIEIKPDTHPDWRGWCNKKCAETDGKSSCSCDYFPMIMTRTGKLFLN